jgi:hypothetical protein
MSSEKESQYLRSLLDILIVNTFMDRSYLKNNAIRTLLREILLKKGFLLKSNCFKYHLIDLIK